MSALEPTQSIAQYAHSVWSRENGHLPARVRALAQTPDGRLWIGTDDGLLRFDGVRFQPWKPPASQQLTSEFINALAPARDGSLWIGTRQGLSHWKDPSFRNYRTSTGPAGPGVAAILVDGAGTLRVGRLGPAGALLLPRRRPGGDDPRPAFSLTSSNPYGWGARGESPPRTEARQRRIESIRGAPARRDAHPPPVAAN